MHPSSRLTTVLNLLVVSVVLAGLVLFLRQRFVTGPGQAEGLEACFGLTDLECQSLKEAQESQMSGHLAPTIEGTPDLVLDAAEVGSEVGYLCAEVERSGSLRILRWPEETHSINVWVPPPEGVPPAVARDLQRAAASGVQVWHQHPFPLTVSTRSVAQDPDITVGWSRSLGENRLGRAEMRWIKEGGEVTVKITSLKLATHYPTSLATEVTPEQLRLVAAHEMGHALGLPHSDSARDVMFPQNTAWRLTQRDFRTMEAVYRIPNGALIR